RATSSTLSPSPTLFRSPPRLAGPRRRLPGQRARLPAGLGGGDGHVPAHRARGEHRAVPALRPRGRGAAATPSPPIGDNTPPRRRARFHVPTAVPAPDHRWRRPPRPPDLPARHGGDAGLH